MRLVFHGAFKNLFGDELSIGLGEGKTLKDLVRYLRSLAPGPLPGGWEENSDAKLSAHVTFLNNGRLMKLDEQIRDEDRIDVVLPLTGG